MYRKYAYILLFSFCFSIIGYGVVTVSNEVISNSNYIKETSPCIIIYKSKPFDFRIETKNYIFYINSSCAAKLQKKISDILFEIKTLKYRNLLKQKAE